MNNLCNKSGFLYVFFEIVKGEVNVIILRLFFIDNEGSVILILVININVGNVIVVDNLISVNYNFKNRLKIVLWINFYY